MPFLPNTAFQLSLYSNCKSPQISACRHKSLHLHALLFFLHGMPLFHELPSYFWLPHFLLLQRHLLLLKFLILFFSHLYFSQKLLQQETANLGLFSRFPLNLLFPLTCKSFYFNFILSAPTNFATFLINLIDKFTLYFSDNFTTSFFSFVLNAKNT